MYTRYIKIQINIRDLKTMTEISHLNQKQRKLLKTLIAEALKETWEKRVGYPKEGSKAYQELEQYKQNGYNLLEQINNNAAHINIHTNHVGNITAQIIASKVRCLVKVPNIY